MAGPVGRSVSARLIRSSHPMVNYDACCTAACACERAWHSINLLLFVRDRRPVVLVMWRCGRGVMRGVRRAIDRLKLTYPNRKVELEQRCILHTEGRIHPCYLLVGSSSRPCRCLVASFMMLGPVYKTRRSSGHGHLAQQA
jgi:hypothetical protein